MSEGNTSEILNLFGKAKFLHPADVPLLLKCMSEWAKINKNRLQVLLLQRKLNNILMLYMKRRQRHLRSIEDFNGPKMLRLLEHIRSPCQFQKLFRIKLPTFFKLKEILYSDDENPPGWMPEIEILLFLFWLSGGLSYKKVEKLLGISESVLKNMFQNIFERFLKNVCQVIHFPKNNFSHVSQGFARITGNDIFGLTAGCMDIFHVMIGFSSHKEDLQYLNDQNEFSVQVQAVCDHRGTFVDIAVGFPGSMFKPHVLQCTPLYLNKILPPPGFILLCGPGYPCLQEPICTITQFSEADDKKKTTFNKLHEEALLILKKSIGQIFDRWRRIFSKPIMYPLSEITNIIIACAMIHNIGLEIGDIWPKYAEVNFAVNQQRVELFEGQKIGETTKKQMADQIMSVIEASEKEKNSARNDKVDEGKNVTSEESGDDNDDTNIMESST